MSDKQLMLIEGGRASNEDQDAQRCFSDARTLAMHMTETTKHENVVSYVRRLKFMLAEAEDNLKFWRETVRMQP